MTFRVLAAAAFSFAVVVALAPTAVADGSAARLVDRSFSCIVQVQAGERRISADANGGFREPQTSRWKWPAYAGVSGRAVVTYAFITGGGPAPSPQFNQIVYPKAIGVDAATCNATKTRIPFSRKGLTGGAVSQLPGVDAYGCDAPPRLLVRIRASFAAPVAVTQSRFFTRRWYTTASDEPARSSQLAVVSAAGTPLVYADASDSGQAHLFTSRTCAAQ